MKLMDIGERKTIDRIWEVIGGKNEDEDVHFIDNGDYYSLLAIDTLNEGIHFKRDWDPYAIGKFLVDVNLSDIASKNGRPHEFMASMSFPRTLDLDYVEGIAEGIRAECSKYEMKFSGGDMKESGLISLTGLVIGGIQKGKEFRRLGARPGDFVYITNKVGKQEKAMKEFYSGSGIPEGIITIEPRFDVLGKMSEHKITSCLDNSDGIYKSLELLARINGVGITIKENVCLEKDEKFRKFCYTFGGDYELIFTSPERIDGFPLIGTVDDGTGVIDLDGFPLSTKGYDHFSVDIVNF